MFVPQHPESECTNIEKNTKLVESLPSANIHHLLYTNSAIWGIQKQAKS